MQLRILQALFLNVMNSKLIFHLSVITICPFVSFVVTSPQKGCVLSHTVYFTFCMKWSVISVDHVMECKACSREEPFLCLDRPTKLLVTSTEKSQRYRQTTLNKRIAPFLTNNHQAQTHDQQEPFYTCFTMLCHMYSLTGPRSSNMQRFHVRLHQVFARDTCMITRNFRISNLACNY